MHGGRAMHRYLLAASVAAALGVLALAGLRYPIDGAHATAQPLNAAVDVTQPVVALPATAIGVNTAVWDPHLRDAAVPHLLEQVGTAIIRFPGGSTSDVYHWRTHSITPTDNTTAAAGNAFDNFMRHVVKPAGAQAMVTVNYGSNAKGTGGADPREAAAWVRYANRTRHYGVRYWEIGNEIYGNGYYGAHWETDLHRDHSPTAYAKNALTFIHAMKAQDRSIKIGLVLALPGVWPDGQGPQDWNHVVLSRACRAADFVSVHWYPQLPGKESDAGLLASVSTIAGMVKKLRSLLAQYCGSRSAGMQIMLTETNSVSSNPGKQSVSVVNGLFLIEDYLSWLQAGVQNVSWWDLHNSADTGNNNSPSLAGSAVYGDYGMLSSGDFHEPPANRPMPSYTALQLLSRALSRGATFVPAVSMVDAVRIYGLKEANGQVAVVLVNTSPTESVTMRPGIDGVGPIRSATVTSFSKASPQPTTAPLTIESGIVSYTMPPYSAAVLQVSASAG